MVARFFVDENDLALGRRLAEERDDVVYPGHEALPEVPRGESDDVWLPVIGSRRLAVITRDKRIRCRPLERRAWTDHRVRGFVLTGRTSQSTDASLAILESHWVRIEELVTERADGPWYGVTTAGLAEIDLGPVPDDKAG